MFLLSFLGNCKKSNSVNLVLEEPFPEKLSEWNLFTGKLSDLKPNSGVLPYDLNMPLFSDYASKSRFVWMPPGKSAQYHNEDTFRFPIGTIIAKTFFFTAASVGEISNSNQIIETRLLVHTNSGWVALPYIWSKDMQDANLEIAGGKRNINYIYDPKTKLELNYSIPNTNQCKGCHENDKQLQPIGPKARNLNKLFTYQDGEENQLIKWKKEGYLVGLPETIDEIGSLANYDNPQKSNLSEQARSYLDINCAHCHNPKGPASTSGLMLSYSETDRKKFGFCKTPVAAGKGSGNLLYDIVPGKPNESILFYRLNSIEPDVMMPELGRSLIHKEGVELIRKWIQSEKGSCI